jgi:zinc protease
MTAARAGAAPAAPAAPGAPGAPAARPQLGAFRPPRMPSHAEEKLDGGLHAITVRRPDVPLVELRLVFPLAAAQLTRPAAPLVLSESILAGTRLRDRQGLATELERLGATLSAGVVGDRLALSGSALAAHTGEFLALVAEVVTSATYPAAEVEADRERTADQVVVLLSRPEALAEEAFARRLFGRHPYAAPVPRPDVLVKVGAPGLRALHRRVVQPAAAHAVLVGDVQPRRALRMLASTFAEWLGSSERVDVALPAVAPVRPGAIDLVHRPGAVQSNVRIGGNAVPRSHPDWPALSLANQIMGGMFTSRLTTNLRERNGYTYSPRSGVDHARAGSTSTISADVATEVTAAALVEVQYELGRLVTAGVTDEELETAKRYATGSFLFQTATQSGLASTLAALAAAGVEPGYLTSYPARLAQVRRQQVDEAARRYFAPTALVTAIVGDADVVSGDLEAISPVRVVEGRGGG